MIAKLNKSNGSVIFIHNIDNGGSDAFEHGIETQNGFIAVGYNYAEDPNNTFHTEGRGLINFLNINGIKTGTININKYLHKPTEYMR